MIQQRRSTRLSVIAAAVVLVLAAIHSAVFYGVTIHIETALPAFISTLAANGWQLEFDRPERTGWPWEPAVRLPHIIASRPVGDHALRWTAERVDLAVPVQDLHALRITPAGEQTLQIAHAAPIRVRAGLATVRVPLSEQEPARFHIRDLKADGAGLDVRASHVDGDIAPSALTLAADAVEITPPLPAPFQGPIAGSATLSTNVLPWSGSASAWAAAGGRMEMSLSEVRWGPLRLTGSGTGRLDQALQPEGRATLRISGTVELLDALARAGVIAPAPASAIRAVLGLLVLAAHGGPVTLPVALSDRTLSVMQFPLLRLSPATWELSSQ